MYAVFLAASDLEHEQDCWEDLKETQEHLGCYSLLDPAWHPNLVSAALRCTQLRQDEGDTMVTTFVDLQPQILGIAVQEAK